MALLRMKPAADPDRAELAAAIARRSEADGKLVAARAACAKVESAIADAETRIRAAQAAKELAIDRHAAQLLRDGVVGVMERPPAEDAAEMELQAAKQALSAGLGIVADYEDDLRRAERKVEAAAAAVMAASVIPALEAVEAAGRELEARRAVLTHLRSFADPDLYFRLEQALPSQPPGSRVDYVSHPAVGPWRAWREALLRDADAALPR
jgi:hypothetical protein